MKREKREVLVYVLVLRYSFVNTVKYQLSLNDDSVSPEEDGQDLELINDSDLINARLRRSSSPCDVLCRMTVYRITPLEFVA